MTEQQTADAFVIAGVAVLALWLAATSARRRARASRPDRPMERLQALETGTTAAIRENKARPLRADLLGCLGSGFVVHEPRGESLEALSALDRPQPYSDPCMPWMLASQLFRRPRGLPRRPRHRSVEGRQQCARDLREQTTHPMTLAWERYVDRASPLHRLPEEGGESS